MNDITLCVPRKIKPVTFIYQGIHHVNYGEQIALRRQSYIFIQLKLLSDYFRAVFKGIWEIVLNFE